MATLWQISALSEDEAFTKRVRMAMVSYATTVGLQRSVMITRACRSAVTEADTYMVLFATVCALNATIQTAAYSSGLLNTSNVLDPDIQAAVQAAWPQIMYT